VPKSLPSDRNRLPVATNDPYDLLGRTHRIGLRFKP